MRPFFWLSLFLTAIYFVYGAYTPFWSLWLAERGLDADQIGLLIGCEDRQNMLIYAIAFDFAYQCLSPLA